MVRLTCAIAIVVMLILLIACGSERQVEQKWPSTARVVDDFQMNGGSSRSVFLQLPENDFNADNIAAIVGRYRLECTPRDLRIIVFSDNQLLERRIDFVKHPVAVDFSNDDAGRQAAKQYLEQTHKWPTGTYVAEYERYFGHEAYKYRLSTKDDHRTIVDLRGSGPDACDPPNTNR